MSRLLSGVRSSCDMFARNSDLYFDVSASCFAFSSSAWRACSTSWFLRSTSAFCSARRPAFSPSSWFVCCRSSCWLWSSRASDCDCSSSSSVRMFASIVLSTMPIDSVSWSRNAWWIGLNASNDASSMTALTWPSKRTGSTMMLRGGASPRPEAICDVVLRDVRRGRSSASRARTARRAPRRAGTIERLRSACTRSPRGAAARGLASRPARACRRPPCCAETTRRELGQDQPADREDVALALQHAAELREVRLQPVLLAVLERRVLQVRGSSR